MTDHEQEKFELQLRQIKPANPPEELIACLRVAEPKAAIESSPASSLILGYRLMVQRSLRWLIPAAAVAVIAAVIWRGSPPSTTSNPATSTEAGAAAVLKADDIRIDQQLVSSFDAVARLPGGELVRFRCENWMDQLILTDKSHGLVMENRSPRLEIVAVGYDTY